MPRPAPRAAPRELEPGEPDWDRTKYFLLFGVAEDHDSNPIKIGLGRLKARQFEYPILILLAALGMGMMASSGDLISLYVGVELQSLALYVMAAFRRDDAKASEAGLKYFVLGALSSGLLLYGASLIYGFAGSMRFM